MRTALLALLLAACGPDLDDVDHPTISTAAGAACLEVAYGWCDASFDCDRDLDSLRTCVPKAFAACLTWTPPADLVNYQADADACATVQAKLACVDEGDPLGDQLENTPTSLGCLAKFWRF